MSDVEPTLIEKGTGRSGEAHEAAIDIRDHRRPSDEMVRSARVGQLGRQRVFDLDFVDAPNLDPVVTSLLERRRPVDESRMDTVLTPNVDIMVQLTRPGVEHSVEWRMFQRSHYCLPDGQPIVLASRLLGKRLGARLPGSDLFAMLWPRLVEGRRSVFIVASSEVIVERLEREYPELRSVVAPMFGADDVDTIDELARTVIASASDGPHEYVIVGVGNPKDARIADSVLRQWPSSLGRPPTILALGASASMYVGLTKRAPERFQRLGLEWFHRFMQEPLRLFSRYFIRDLAFIPLVWRHWRADHRTDPASAIEDERTP